ncbi:MAG: helicase/SNF2 family domain protein [Pseudomonas sp.]|nr:helicase/SNF2 family domain protein [Pseudomonas sp.]
MLHHLSAELVQTLCRGSSLEIYTQTLKLKDPEKYSQFVVAKCTCPVRNNCKHCAAALFFLQAPENQPSILAALDVPEPTPVPAPAIEHKPSLPERVVDYFPLPRLALASVEYSAYEPRNGRMQRHLKHRDALALKYGP